MKSLTPPPALFCRVPLQHSSIAYTLYHIAYPIPIPYTMFCRVPLQHSASGEAAAALDRAASALQRSESAVAPTPAAAGTR